MRARGAGLLLGSLALAASAGWHGPARANVPEAPVACEGARANTMTVAGCEAPFCEEGERRAQFLSLTDITLGELLTGAQLQRVRARFLATGFFQQISLRCTRQGEDVALIIDVVPHRFIRQVTIDGNRFYQVSDLRKRLFLRPGTPFLAQPGEELTDETVQRQLASFRRLYREGGLEEIDIRIEAIPVEDGMVDIEVTIDEGQRDRLREITIEHVEGLVPQDPSELRCIRLPRELLKDVAEIRIGDVVTSKTERTVRKRLKAWLHSVGFVKPDIEIDISGEPLHMTVRVTTVHCWLLRVWQRDAARRAENDTEPSLRFQDPVEPGAKKDAGKGSFRRADYNDWREFLPFANSGVFDVKEAARGVDTIRANLVGQGFAFADVSLEHRLLQDGTVDAGPVLGVIDYFITRNFARRIRAMSFPGADSFEPLVLRGLMETGIYDFFGKPGDFQPEKVFADLRKLATYYRERGYHSFRFGLEGGPHDSQPSRTAVETAAEVSWEYRFRDLGFRIIKQRGEMTLELEIPVHEGVQTRVGEVVFRGTDALTEVEARALLGLKRGGVYGTKALNEGIKRVEDWYRRHGYQRTQITTACEGEDPAPPDGVCLVGGIPSGTIHLFITVLEGPQTHVGEIFWRGNYVTRDDVLTRDLPRTGSVFDPGVISEAARRLRNLGVFDSVQVNTIGLDEVPPRDRVAVVVTVEEAETQFLDLAVGFRTIERVTSEKSPEVIGSVLGQSVAASDRSTTGFSRAFNLALPEVLFVAEAEYVNRNFVGLAHELRIPLQVGLSTTTNPLRLASLEPTYIIPRLETFDALLDTRIFGRYDRVTEIQDYTEIGASSGLTWPLLERMNLTLSFAFSFIDFEDPDLPEEDRTLAFHPQTRLLLQWRWDNQDNPLHPTRGFAISVGLGHIFDFSESIRQGTAGKSDQDNFIKAELAAEYVLKIPKVDLIFAAMAHIGVAAPLNDADDLLPLNQRFTLGGSNGLRGYPDNGIGRYDAQGTLVRTQETGGNVVVNGSFELRFPILKRLGFWGVGFFDWGALALDLDELVDAKGQNIRMSAGMGIRYLVGGQIPIRVDVGFPVPGPRESAPCAVGAICDREDRLQVHLGFLYPF